VGILVALVANGPVARIAAGVDSTMPPGLLDLSLALAAAIVVVFLASLYPAARAAGLSPTLAMKRV